MSEEQVMVITGASNGLGAAVAEHFAVKGYGVVAHYFTEERGQATYDHIAERAGEERLMKFQADVAEREQVSAMFDATMERFGRVDILMNFAGVNIDGPFIDMTDEQFDRVISSHLKGHFICCQEYVRRNTDRPGSIITLGATCGQIGRLNGANFCSAKGGILALTKCMARELAPRIRVNCLMPGSIQTQEVVDRYDLDTEEGRAREIATLPMGRLGELGDATQMVEAILGAEFTTGENFYVNGGQYMA
jgi:NAD(P)-dependent dehydrogenase (short-subunit alcohol dehydrogenase family)